MFAILVRELIEHLSSFRFGAVFLLAQATMVAGVVVFGGEYETRMREYPERVRSLVNEEGLTSLRNVPCNGGITVERRPSRLAFCAGIGERELPNQVAFAVHGLKRVQRRGDVTDVLGSGLPVDWAYIVTVLMSFAAGVLTYRSVAGEREDGTLALVLANPVSRASLLFGKYLASLLALTVPVVFGGILGILVLRLQGSVILTGEDWVKLAMVLALALLYLSCFVLIGMACSVLSRSATIAAVAFLFLWALLVFVAPNVAGMVASELGDVPTPSQMRGRAEAIVEEIPLAIGADSEEISRVSLERELAQERLLLEYVRSLEGQVQLGQHLSRMSPASAFSFAAEEIAGTGLGRFHRFVDNALRFRRQVFEAILAADAEDEESEHRYQPWSCGGNHFSHRDVDLGPARVFADPPGTSGQVLQAASLDVILLACYNVVLFLVTFAVFMRQDVTVGSAR